MRSWIGHLHGGDSQRAVIGPAYDAEGNHRPDHLRAEMPHEVVHSADRVPVERDDEIVRHHARLRGRTTCAPAPPRHGTRLLEPMVAPETRRQHRVVAADADIAATY